MKRISKICLVIIACLSQIFFIQSAGVTYDFSGGRFGDDMLSYAHARYVAYKYNLPFIYKHFTYTHQLAMSKIYGDQNREDEESKYEKKITWSRTGQKVRLEDIIDPATNLLYVIPYFPESAYDLTHRWHFEVDWKDENFKKILRAEFAPIKPLQELSIPLDRFCLAVHIRRGGGFKDDPLLQDAPEFKEGEFYADVKWPHKFPPVEYYIEQISKISGILNDQPIYAHIFTDDIDPGALVDRIRKSVNKANIIYGSRLNDNRHDANVLDDFFALTQFNGLIRGDSNFSIMAAKLADYIFEISPKSSHWQGTKLIIDDTYGFENLNTALQGYF